MFSQTILVGNLGDDPEIRHSEDGTAFCTMSVATSKKWIDKASGELKEQTEWHRVSIVGKQAESCNEFLKKGAKVQVIGENQTRKWTDKGGVDRWTTEVRANRVIFLSSSKDGGDRPPTPTPPSDGPGIDGANLTGDEIPGWV